MKSCADCGLHLIVASSSLHRSFLPCRMHFLPSTAGGTFSGCSRDVPLGSPRQCYSSLDLAKPFENPFPPLILEPAKKRTRTMARVSGTIFFLSFFLPVFYPFPPVIVERATGSRSFWTNERYLSSNYSCDHATIRGAINISHATQYSADDIFSLFLIILRKGRGWRCTGNANRERKKC